MSTFMKSLVGMAVLGALLISLMVIIGKTSDSNQATTARVPVATSTYSSAGMLVLDTLEHDGHKWVAATRRGVGGVAILHHPDCACFVPKKQTEPR